MNHLPSTPSCRRGFSLLELSIAIVLAGIVAGTALKINQSTNKNDCYATTRTQLETVRDALDRFAVKHDRLPLPALRTAGVENTMYGREAPLSSLNSIGGVTYGALPFQALGLSPSYGGDCWGNKFTYVVTTAITTSATVGGYLDMNVLGKLQVKSSAANTLMTDAAFAVISHGADAVGAVKTNYSGGASGAGWCNVGSVIQTDNCDVSNNTIVAGEFNDGQTAAARMFDDLVTFRAKLLRKPPVNGVCGSSSNTCAAGSVIGFVPGPCSANDTWTCQGLFGGTDSPTCTAATGACPPPPPAPSPSPSPSPSPGPCVPNVGAACMYDNVQGPYCGGWGNCGDPAFYTHPSFCGNFGWSPDCWDTGPDANCHTCTQYGSLVGTIRCNGSCGP